MILEPDYFTRRAPAGYDLDSVAAALGKFYVTAKRGRCVLEYDLFTGEQLREIRPRSGDTGRPVFERPNGIAADGDRALYVVDRDARSVVELRLPGCEVEGAPFGEDVFVKPYGACVCDSTACSRLLYVTDSRSQEESSSDLGAGAVARAFRLSRGRPPTRLGGRPPAYLGAVGNAALTGAVGKTESVCADPYGSVLMLADEFARDVKSYTSDGAYQRTENAYFLGEPEGICTVSIPGSGWFWVFADQAASPEKNSFHASFESGTLRFRVRGVSGTDGICFAPAGACARFPKGALLVLDSDERVAVVDARRLTEMLLLPKCLACGSEASYVCGGCRSALYCGHACCDENWPKHWKTCLELDGRP